MKQGGPWPRSAKQIPLLGTLNLQRDSVQLWSVDTHVSPELEGSVDQHPGQPLILLQTAWAGFLPFEPYSPNTSGQTSWCCQTPATLLPGSSHSQTHPDLASKLHGHDPRGLIAMLASAQHQERQCVWKASESCWAATSRLSPTRVRGHGLHSEQKPVVHIPLDRTEAPARRPTAVGRSSSTQHTEGREHDKM